MVRTFRSSPSFAGHSCRGALFLLTLLASVAASSAQTFVAEWAQADIGRVGPTGMALDTVGGKTYLYVADQPAGRILKIDVATGQRVAAWGQVGNGRLEFNSPYGIAIEPVTHDLYIAERGNNRVQRITNTGAFVMGWGDSGTAPGQFRAPFGIAADNMGNVYVVDHENDRVEKFNVRSTAGGWDVQFVTAWGSRGSAPGQFDAPYGLALDRDGNVWVADGRNHRLQKFDSSGRFLAAFGSRGTGNGQFITPTWISFDAAGGFYVAETNTDPQDMTLPDISHQRIQKFNADGTFALKWGAYGEAGGQFKLPFQAVADAGGKVYVSDYYNTRVQVFTLNPPTGGGGGGGSAAPFINLSTRLRTRGDQPLIAGFVVSGSTPKTVLVRAIGPSLAPLGVSNALPNPKLRIFSGSTQIAENEDWGGTAAITAACEKVGAFGVPANSRDAALVITLQPGTYSAQVLDNGGDGVALVEVYDADASTTCRAVNLSTRGRAETGDGVLVAGFVVGGSVPKRVLIRGVGPTLTAYGVAGAMANPVLRIYTSGGTLIAQNDDWGTPMTVTGGGAPASGADISTAGSAAGAFPLPGGSRDSAVVVTLAPGAYSAIVSGAGETSGTALAEVYELP